MAPEKLFGPENMSVLEALKRKDRSLALERLCKGAVLNDKDEYGNTALHYAAAFGYMDVIEKILEARSDLAVC
ncbi:MAG TPA: ankyrin repeat domain-containing protein [Nitrospira sp.]|nr:ankyrin repeat domain-containing protein [Nitrospira sp.]